MAAQNLTLDVTVSCVNGSTTDDCIAKIKNNQADLVTLDGGKVYDAGKIKGIHTSMIFNSGSLASCLHTIEKQFLMKLRNGWLN